MEQNFNLIAKTFMGLEPVLAKELTQLGANDVRHPHFETHQALQGKEC